MAQAYTDSVPLLVLAGQIRSEWLGRGGGHFHELKDQLGMARTLIGHAERVPTTEAISDALDRAMATLRGGRPRGAYLEFPQDVLGGRAPSVPAVLPRSSPLVVDPGAVSAAARVLGTATRPVVVAGGGARGAREVLLEVAVRLDAPVLTTIAATGSLPLTHPLVIGGGVDLQAARDLLEASDAVLVVGSDLSQTDFWPGFPALNGPLVQIDVDRSALGGQHPAEVPIVADARAALALIAAALPTATHEHEAGAARADATRAALDREAAHDAAPYRPVVETLASSLRGESIVALDLTGPTYWAVPRFLRAPHPHQRLLSGIGTLGYAVPAAIGAKLARPGSQVVALVGDGGFTFTGQELLTATQERVCIFVLVWNNGGYGDIRQQMLSGGARALGVDLRGPDVVAFARACGAQAARLEDVADLPALLRRAADFAGPTVVEVRAEH
jgi:acetolactate synthase-1/2/3 large subunit